MKFGYLQSFNVLVFFWLQVLYSEPILSVPPGPFDGIITADVTLILKYFHSFSSYINRQKLPLNVVQMD